ncbi:phosphoglycerate kinase [Neoasaia chiangmaiensis NBRC 101099]|uniref:Phosphoglycerate kinase n=1 Tax=Neoasaia chiangmaiensis TaxID=320497 RepID=A0A1U9KM91_9PROT|nr:phosphoglycerate kinase [Neoasaia chiangmaiensis]AQS86911.1 phosphoglycerate kinase [Neoasaia chiangmaiensis]GBR37563.1 phosphoglycerate kinase [Neoasaia chiangmaiensis NBRC 101099]GEN15011.1 phosphoglycerate kinase [Neoasaia chiangmaiensis]
MPAFRTLDHLSPAGKRVLLRADLNVPVRDGRITDTTRIDRVIPTIIELADKGAQVIVLSHFDRPKGQVVPHMSLAPIAEMLESKVQHRVYFQNSCIGPEAESAVDRLRDGEVLVLENTRFHAGEEANDAEFTAMLARHGDFFVNDAFSAAHRAHASTEGLARHMPSFAGRLMEAELNALSAALELPDRPVGALIGGAKVSTKLDLIGNVLGKVDTVFIGGAMANTFLAAEGISVGKSLQEADMHETARRIVVEAREKGCEIILPVDAVIAREFRENAPSEVCLIGEVPPDAMILDAGPRTVELIEARLTQLKTLVWNGPLGAFEIPPFDAATVAVAKAAASLTQEGKLKTIAGGGDTVSALRHAGVADRMSYVSTAGGAFLEWLEGKILPGIAVLTDAAQHVAPL